MRRPKHGALLLLLAAVLAASTSSFTGADPERLGSVGGERQANPVALSTERVASGNEGPPGAAAFLSCFTGPSGTVGAECEVFDFDIDGDVDLNDFAAFQFRFTQAPVPTPDPNLWQIVEAQAAPAMVEDPAVPIIDVAAEAARTPPGPGDLAPTIDVQITQEIIDKATELGTPEAMYEFVRNECAFQAYYGSRKGSVETLRQRAGNDYDLASLLIALLRASGYPARYAIGMTEMPAAQATGWLAVDDGRVAGSILYTMGLEGVSVWSGTPDNIVTIRCRRVWVEAYVPRGYGSPTWVPLDPAFALTAVHEGVDIPEQMNLDAQAFVDEYYDPSDPGVTLPRPETVLQLLKQQITDYLDAGPSGLTLSDVMRTHEIAPENLGVLPASLPYVVRSRDTEFSEVPASRRYQVRFHLRNGGTNLINHTFNLPEIAGRRVTIDYVGATPADQAIIDTAGGIYQIPNAQIASVSLKPVLRLEGQDVALGSTGVGMGRVHESDMHFLAPVNAQGLPQNVVPAIYNTIVCGASQAIGIAIDGVSEGLLNPPPDDDTEGMASLLYDTAMDYLARCRNSDLELGRLMHAYVTTGVADAILENVVNVTYNAYGVPQSFEWVGLRVDADRSVLGIWPVDRFAPPDPENKDFMIIAGAEGSLFENRIFEDSYGQDSVSTLKILQLAADQGVTIYKRWSSTTLPPNTQPSVVRSAIQSAIAGGHVVTFPAAPITAGTPETGEWTGTGWIDMDPSNGAAGYIISGNHNGGATVDWWPPEAVDLMEGDRTCTSVDVLIDEPDADSPQASAIFTRDNPEFITFKYHLTAHYDDGSSQRIPPNPGEFFERTTHYTTQQFSPDNYVFTVWVSRWFWWGELGSAERQISIVGVLIRGDDGTQVGTEPPKYIPVEPPAPTPTPSVDVMALVIPDKAPNGATLASGYSWSGGGKLAFTPSNQRQIQIEPNSDQPSAALEDQAVNVAVTLPGGKIAHGFAKFHFWWGQDEPHKMTVYGVEVKAEDGTSDPPEYVPVNKSQTLKGIVKPTGVSGQFEDWTTTSTKATLSHPWWGLFGKDKVEVKGGATPSIAVEDEEITPNFKADGASAAQAFEPHKMTVVKVDFGEYTTPRKYGFDSYTNSEEPYKSVKVGDMDKATAEMQPNGVTASETFFKSTSTGKVTVSPGQATAWPQDVIVTGVARGAADVEANVHEQDGETAGVMKTKAYTEVAKTLAVILVHEENDDVQIILRGQGEPDETSISTGADGICQTLAAAGDNQVVPVGQGQPFQPAITAGPNAVFDSTPQGDDLLGSFAINTGADGVCQTTAAADDVQILAVGNGAANMPAVTTGSDGISQSHPGGDDVLAIPLGNGGPNAIAITVGANGFRDSVQNTLANGIPTGGDDQLDGDDITTGANGVCDTEARNASTPSTDIASISALRTYLNATVYNQAVLSWTVTKLASATVNFDLNRDGHLDVSSWMTAEMQAIRDTAKADAYDKNIFLVDNPNRSYFGMMMFRQRYGFVHPDEHAASIQTIENTIAHELGHGLGLHHPDSDMIPPDPDPQNLMHSTNTNPWRLRQWQWNQLNP